ncbi:MAG: hypothetical protein R3F62_28330 [Planctomycetota bacterium]
MSSFSAWAAARGATLSGERALDFGDPAGEARALREGVGLWWRADWEPLWLRGGDRLPFLHKYCTQDVATLAPGSSTYGCCLTVKGTLVGDFSLHVLDDAALLLVAPGAGDALLAHLGKFAVFDDVSLERAEDVEVLSLLGPQAEGLVNRALGVALEPGKNAAARLGETELRVAREEPAGVRCYDLLVPRGACVAVADALAAEAPPVGRLAIDALRVARGWPLFGVDMGEKTIPNEAGLKERAVSFSKGCYLGQEVVVRIEHRGHVNRMLVALRPESAPGAAPLPVFVGAKEVGQLTTLAELPDGPAGLGILHRKAWGEDGAEVHVGAPDGPRAQISALPLA